METMNFISSPVSQSDLVSFGDERVNLKQEYAQRYRDQVANLREHLDRYITEHPELGLVKMLLSGSLAKGTALSSIKDVDVAIYVKGGTAPEELGKLLEWLADRLRETYHQIAPQDIKVDGPCVTIAFSGTGIKVEVAPIYYLGDPAWRGYLWDRTTGKRVTTSIPQHLEFIRKRKEAHPVHFAQVVRLAKWWAKQRDRDTPGFKLRSFLVELVMVEIADDGQKFDDYHAALEGFFAFIQNSGLKKRIAFADYYSVTALPKAATGAVEIFDPVNPENNVASDISDAARRQLVDLAGNALDALSYARTCQTKGNAVDCWKELMGVSFNA